MDPNLCLPCFDHHMYRLLEDKEEQGLQHKRTDISFHVRFFFLSKSDIRFTFLLCSWRPISSWKDLPKLLVVCSQPTPSDTLQLQGPLELSTIGTPQFRHCHKKPNGFHHCFDCLHFLRVDILYHVPCSATHVQQQTSRIDWKDEMGFLVNCKRNFEKGKKKGRNKKKERTNSGTSTEMLPDPKRFAFDTSRIRKHCSRVLCLGHVGDIPSHLGNNKHTDHVSAWHRVAIIQSPEASW